MNTFLDGLRKLVASFDANQRAIIKTTVDECIAKYDGELPNFVENALKHLAEGQVDKAIDGFLDDTK